MPGVVLRTLPNGLRLIVREQHSAPLVAVDAWVRAGSGREADGESGAAHFVEHLLFKGTPTRKAGEIDGAIEDLGATLSAFTSRDAVHFSTTVPTAHTQTAVEVMADILRNSLLTSGEVARERKVILDELARGRNDLRKETANRALAALFKGHPYAYPVLGSPESIGALQRETIAAFYRRWYTPANTTVVVVGDIAVDRAEEMVRSAFGAWAGTSPQPPGGPAPPSLLPEGGEPRLAISGESVAVPASARFVAAAYDIRSEKPGADAAPGLVLATILADNLSRRMESSPEGAAEGAPSARAKPPLGEPFGEMIALPDRSALIVGVSVTAAGAAELAKSLEADVERICKEPPTDAQLDAARRTVVGTYLYDVETYSGQARALGMYDVLGDYTAASSLVDALAALRPADISAFAQRRLKLDSRVVITLRPPSRP